MGLFDGKLDPSPPAPLLREGRVATIVLLRGDRALDTEVVRENVDGNAAAAAAAPAEGEMAECAKGRSGTGTGRREGEMTDVAVDDRLVDTESETEDAGTADGLRGVIGAGTAGRTDRDRADKEASVEADGAVPGGRG